MRLPEGSLWEEGELYLIWREAKQKRVHMSLVGRACANAMRSSLEMECMEVVRLLILKLSCRLESFK